MAALPAEVRVPSETYSAYNPDEPEAPSPVSLLALVLAWAVPGLGHIMIGQKARGIVFMVTIHALFAAGLLIGGIRAINPPDQAIWTYTQFLTGWPMLVANFEEKNRFEPIYVQPDPRDGNHRPPIRIEFENEAAAKNIDLNDQTNEGLAKRKAFTEDFIARYPLFSYHPKVQDMGAVYCGIAGMLNLLVMFDVLLRVTGSVREDPKKRRTGGSPAAAGVSA